MTSAHLEPVHFSATGTLLLLDRRASDRTADDEIIVLQPAGQIRSRAVWERLIASIQPEGSGMSVGPSANLELLRCRTRARPLSLPACSSSHRFIPQALRNREATEAAPRQRGSHPGIPQNQFRPPAVVTSSELSASARKFGHVLIVWDRLPPRGREVQHHSGGSKPRAVLAGWSVLVLLGLTGVAIARAHGDDEGTISSTAETASSRYVRSLRAATFEPSRARCWCRRRSTLTRRRCR